MCQWYTGTRIVCNLIPPGGLHQHVPISPRSAVGVRRPASRGACGNRRTVHLNVRRLEEFRREAASRGGELRREAFPRGGSRQAEESQPVESRQAEFLREAFLPAVFPLEEFRQVASRQEEFLQAAFPLEAFPRVGARQGGVFPAACRQEASPPEACRRVACPTAYRQASTKQYPSYRELMWRKHCPKRARARRSKRV